MTAKPPSGLAASGAAQQTLDALDAIDIDDEVSSDAKSDATPAPTSFSANDAAKVPPPPVLDPANVKTPAPVANRDAGSALPSIPMARREPSGAFPLPGMAAPDATKSDEDVTLIARLSVLDELAEESTKVEPLESALRAAASKIDPIALVDQANAQRDKALGASASEQRGAAEFEDPGDDDDELTVSATPGIISISEDWGERGGKDRGGKDPGGKDSDDDDDEDTTASHRPPGARRTPTPVTAGPLKTPAPWKAGVTSPPSAMGPLRLPTPAPLFGGARLPAPRLPTPSGGLSTSTGVPVPAPPAPSSRAFTPALPIPAPIGALTTAPMSRSAVFNKVQLPVGGLVAFLVFAFLGGLVLGAFLWHGEAPPPMVVEPTAPPAVVAPEPVAAEPAAPAPVVIAPVAPAPEKAIAEPMPAPKPVEAAPVVPEKPAPVVDEKPVTVEKVAPAPKAKVAAVAPKPKATPPIKAAPAPKPEPVAAAPKHVVAPVAHIAKPAAAPKRPPGKPVKGSKNWVDPFAE
ncbi:MAG: hypothetical protein JWM82_1262 [Myxococcales bacterium]|nr:hypothetical protein [Myxococcales bacterium]